jgi:hypothetical protein
VLDFDVLSAFDADCVTREPQISFFQVVTLVGVFCHVSKEGFDCSDTEEGGLLAASIGLVGQGWLIAIEP